MCLFLLLDQASTQGLHALPAYAFILRSRISFSLEIWVRLGTFQTSSLSFVLLDSFGQSSLLWMSFLCLFNRLPLNIFEEKWLLRLRWVWRLAQYIIDLWSKLDELILRLSSILFQILECRILETKRLKRIVALLKLISSILKLSLWSRLRKITKLLMSYLLFQV